MLIVGTGAIATFLAQAFWAGTQNFQLYGPPSQRTQALEGRFPGRVITSPREVEEGRPWIVCSKSWQNQDKVQELFSAPSPESVLILQNGLCPDRDWFPLSARVERGLCTYGVRVERPGQVSGGGQGEFVVGADSSFAKALICLGLRCRESSELQAAIWHKLAVNASLNVVATLFGLRNGEVLAHPWARSLAEGACREVRVLALRAGVAWGELDPWELTAQVAEQTSENICSTLVDRRRGGPTEYGSINGELLRLARSLNEPIPYLSRLDQAFRGASLWEEAC